MFDALVIVLAIVAFVGVTGAAIVGLFAPHGLSVPAALRRAHQVVRRRVAGVAHHFTLHV